MLDPRALQMYVAFHLIKRHVRAKGRVFFSFFINLQQWILVLEKKSSKMSLDNKKVRSWIVQNKKGPAEGPFPHSFFGWD